MKILFVGFFSGVIFILSNKYHVTDGQYFANASFHFVPFEFDTINRGLWNASECLRDLLNCWEITKADILCSYDKYKDTICGFWKDHCDDKFGKQDNPGSYSLFEGFCSDERYQVWTK